MDCPFGSVVWRVKAKVHRPGAFRTKLVAAREVTVVSCISEEDIEEDNIFIQRQWEQELHYLIAIGGRSFYIGGTIPITITLMPLSKLKIYQLSVYIEGEC